ncbi:MAG: putative entry exclusion protein TrbK-alt [Sphingorhabdus sp.]
MKKPSILAVKHVAFGLAGLLFVIWIVNNLHEAGQRPALADKDDLAIVEPDPLSAELRRCSRLPHVKAMEDELCRRAWVLNRERFFGSSGEHLSAPDTIAPPSGKPKE